MTDNLPDDSKLKDLISFNAPRNKIDIEKALSLKIDNGLSYADIGKYFGVSTEIIFYHLRGLVPDDSNLQAYRKYRGDILDSKQEIILKSLTAEELKEATPYQRVGMYGILYDKSRLEHDKSTRNASFLDMTQEYNASSKRRRELLDQLGLDEDVDVDTLEE